MHNKSNEPTRRTDDASDMAACFTSVLIAKLLESTTPVLLCFIFCALGASPLHAQMFGARKVGSPISSPLSQGGGLNSNAAGSAVGILNGNERFVRGNRSRRDFVGSDRNEQSGFVGAGQAIGVGRVPSATEGLRIQTADTARINRPIPVQPSKGIYYPRLEIGFDIQQSVTFPSAELVADERMLGRVINVTGSTVQLTLAGRTAILRGTVNSAHDAELAERLLSFEPGIDSIQNELSIAE
ncbi:MAG: hypothetical protein ABI557_05815 [Aureliella sp.]